MVRHDQAPQPIRGAAGARLPGILGAQTPQIEHVVRVAVADQPEIVDPDRTLVEIGREAGI